MLTKSDPIHPLINIVPLESQIISSDLFNRLQYITQTSTSYFAFPSLKHTRYSHSIGTMHVAGVMIRAILKNSSAEIINKLLKQIEDILKYTLNNVNGRFHQEIGEYIARKNANYSLEDILRKSKLYADELTAGGNIFENFLMQTVRIVGLLHDLGHLPFSHLFEEILSEYYSSIKDKPEDELSENEKVLLNILKKLIEKPDKRVDLELTREELLSRLNNDNNDSNVKINNNSKDILEKKEEIHEYLGEIITHLIFKHLKTSTIEDKIYLYLLEQFIQYTFLEVKFDVDNEIFDFKWLHQIVAGAIDADRLDYTLRDILQSGLNLASFNLYTITNGLSFIKRNNNLHLSFPITALSDIERFFVSRYESYNEVIFHHKVQRTNEILKNVLKILLKEWTHSNNKNISSGFVIDCSISGLVDVLKSLTSTTNTYEEQAAKFNQFEENWLIGMLKKYKYETENEKLKSLLEDVLDDCGNYITIWNNLYQFKKDIKTYLNRKISNNYNKINLDFDINAMLYDYLVLEKRLDTIFRGEKYFYSKKGFKGANGVNNIYIKISNSEYRKFSEVSNIEQRLLSRIKEAVPINFYTSESDKEDIKKIILDILKEYFLFNYLADVIEMNIKSSKELAELKESLHFDIISDECNENIDIEIEKLYNKKDDEKLKLTIENFIKKYFEEEG